MIRFFALAGASLCLLSAGAASSQASHAIPSIGAVAPDFTLPDQNGSPHRLASYRGHTVVLAFYPKDFTLG